MDLDSLIQALDHPTSAVRNNARLRLVEIGESALDGLLVAMQSGNIRLSWQAAVVLGDIPSPRWIGPMSNALTSDNILLGQAAVQALENALESESVTIFIDTFSRCRPVVQLTIIGALERLNDKRSIAPLCTFLAQTDNPEIRYTIVQALGTLGDASVIPIINQYRADPNRHVRERVELALSHLGA